MRSRGLVVVLALILATLATVGVFLYSQGVKEEARTGGDLVTVVVSKVDIPANTDLNALIRDDRFTTLDLPRESLVDEPVRQLSQLQGRRNSVYIFAGEQIPVARVEGAMVPGGLLSIPAGHQALTVSLEAPRVISGALAGGDNVTIYGSFEDVRITLFPKEFLHVRGVRPPAGTPSGGGTAGDAEFDATAVLAPEVEVLRVTRPVISAEGPVDESAIGDIQVTLALLPDEARRLVFGMEMGTVYMSLLRPDERGTDLDTLTMWRVLLEQAGEN